MSDSSYENYKKSNKKSSRDDLSPSEMSISDYECDNDTEEKIKEIDKKLLEICVRYIKADICDVNGRYFTNKSIRIPKVVDMIFIHEKNIMYDNICNVHKILVQLVTLTYGVNKLFDTFICRELQIIEKNDINRITYHKDHIDIAILTKCSLLTAKVCFEFNEMLDYTIKFFSLLNKKNKQIFEFSKKIEDFELKMLTLIQESVSEIQTFGYENIDEIIKFLYEELQKKEKELTDLIPKINTKVN